MEAGDELKLVFWTQQGNQAGLMVASYFVFNTPGSIPIADQDGLDIISDGMAAVLKPLMTGGAEYLGVVMYRPDIIPLPAALYSTQGAGVGTAGTVPMATQVTGLITLRTALAGRANRGRKYVPFPDAADSVGSINPIPSTSYKTRLDALADKFGPGADFEDPANPGTFVNLSGIIVAANGTIRGDVTSTVQRRLWATQRRRGAYGKSNLPPF